MTRRTTVTIIRIGATKNYASNWGLAFGQKPPAKAGTVAKKSAPPPKKKASKNKPAPGQGK